MGGPITAYSCRYLLLSNVGRGLRIRVGMGLNQKLSAVLVQVFGASVSPPRRLRP